MATLRRCAFCFGLDGDATEKEGQIAHVDRDPSNATPENAAWLCTKHHSRYDSRSLQTKGHTPEELRGHQAALLAYLASPHAWPDSSVTRRHNRTRGVSLAVFDRRVPTYRTTIQFIRTLLKLDKIPIGEMLEFAAATDEALFLFDDSIAKYLSKLFKRGLHLRAIGLNLEVPQRFTPDLSREQAELALWFSKQFEETRRRFAPFLRLE